MGMYKQALSWDQAKQKMKSGWEKLTSRENRPALLSTLLPALGGGIFSTFGAPDLMWKNPTAVQRILSGLTGAALAGGTGYAAYKALQGDNGDTARAKKSKVDKATDALKDGAAKISGSVGGLKQLKDVKGGQAALDQERRWRESRSPFIQALAGSTLPHTPGEDVNDGYKYLGSVMDKLHRATPGPDNNGWQIAATTAAAGTGGFIGYHGTGRLIDKLNNRGQRLDVLNKFFEAHPQASKLTPKEKVVKRLLDRDKTVTDSQLIQAATKKDSSGKTYVDKDLLNQLRKNKQRISGGVYITPTQIKDILQSKQTRSIIRNRMNLSRQISDLKKAIQVDQVRGITDPSKLTQLKALEKNLSIERAKYAKIDQNIRNLIRKNKLSWRLPGTASGYNQLGYYMRDLFGIGNRQYTQLRSLLENNSGLPEPHRFDNGGFFRGRRKSNASVKINNPRIGRFGKGVAKGGMGLLGALLSSLAMNSLTGANDTYLQRKKLLGQIQ